MRIVLAVAFLATGGSAWAESLDESRAVLYRNYAQELAELADGCKIAGLVDDEKRLRGWLPRRDSRYETLFVLAAQTPSGEAAAEPAKPVSAWAERFSLARKEQAKRLMTLAKRAIAEDDPSLARILMTEAVREDPLLAPARRVLGYVLHEGVWQTHFARQMLETGHIWHERFGWLRESYVKRYEAGLRRYRNRWVEAKEEARLRRDISSGWQVRTAHYLVTTNHSLEEGVRLAKQLERLHQIWRQLFVGYYASAADLKKMAQDRPPTHATRKPHEVIYYRTRDQYNAALRKDQANIDVTLGIYFDSHRRAYFFAGEDQHAGTVFHEATHQLFQETRSVAKTVGRRNNFWIVEGIATYFESLGDHGDYVTLGEPAAGRLPAARVRLLQDGFYVPFDELTQLGMDDLQRHPEIAKLYSQAYGQATFLMHADNHRYRDPLVRYLVAVYTNKVNPRTLEALSETSYDKLDRQYREFLQRAETEQ